MACLALLALAPAALVIAAPAGAQGPRRPAPSVTVAVASPTITAGTGTRVSAVIRGLPPGTLARFAWTLDDAPLAGDAATVTATPTTAGAHTVAVTVTYFAHNGGGRLTGEARITVLAVAGAAPVASFTVTPDPSDPRRFTVTSTSTDRDTPVALLRFTWDLNGDGRFGDAITPQATATFAGPGTYVVGLRVSDGTSSDTATRAVTIADHAPTVALRISPTPARVGQPVTIAATASDPDGDPLTYTWDVAGTKYTGPAVPVQVFNRAGTYKVKVTVTARDASASDADAIVVAAPSGGGAGGRLLLPFPVVRVQGQVFADGTKFDVVSARTPRRARARARCTGKGCPRRHWTRAAAMPRTRWVRFTQLERKLAPGAVIEIFVTQRGRIGKYARFLVRAGKPPARRDGCVRGVRLKVMRCPAR